MARTSSVPGVGHRKLILIAIVVIAVLSAAVIVVLYAAPELITDLSASTAALVGGAIQNLSPSIKLPDAAGATPSNPFENVEEKSNPFKITNPFEYKSPFG